ncbi:PilZ domain-containing protein [Reinekea sp.]|uniref:PilZ domain-containing protein n=1 Tax=Reinekea sp. TaxID=1970455 RepID=UPI00398943D1
MKDDKRRFQRIPFEATVHVTIGKDSVIQGSLRDISLKGALIALAEQAHMPAQSTDCEITVKPDESDFSIQLSAQVAYIDTETQTFGVNITKLELDSATHLRRLIEVNLGSEAALQRELTNLISALAS